MFIYENQAYIYIYVNSKVSRTAENRARARTTSTPQLSHVTADPGTPPTSKHSVQSADHLHKLIVKHTTIIAAHIARKAGSDACPANSKHPTTNKLSGIRNTEVTVALISFGTSSARSTDMAGQYVPKQNSNAQKLARVP
jgi:hypothetical protein